MAITKGSEGSATFSDGTTAQAIVELKDWSISESAETIETTSMGNTTRTKTIGLTSASGSMTMFWDVESTGTDLGQATMVVGAKAELVLYPKSGKTGTCTAIITERGVSVSLDGLVETSVSFEVSGTVVWA
jgi:hypothetical protein